MRLEQAGDISLVPSVIDEFADDLRLAYFGIRSLEDIFQSQVNHPLVWSILAVSHGSGSGR